MAEALCDADVTKLCLYVCTAACALLNCALPHCLANVSESVPSLVDYSKALCISFNKHGANSMGPFF